MTRALRKSQEGAALILVLGIISVMSTMAIFSFDSLTRLISMTTAQSGKAQARQHALAAEQIAINVTQEVLKQDVNLRQQAENGDNRFVFNRDGARISGTISDLTNCFNIVSLVTGYYGSDWKMNERATGQFSRLLQNYGLGEKAAQAISLAAADWQDSDLKPLPNGAEGAYYADLNPPYQQPNAPMASTNELRLIRDVTPKLMRALDDMICADAVVPTNYVNISMLEPKHAPLLQAFLGPTSSEVQIRDMLEQQPPTGFTKDQFWEQPALVNLVVEPSVKAMFTNKSRRVRVKINIETDTGRTQMQTDIHFHPNQTYTILAREFGAL